MNRKFVKALIACLLLIVVDGCSFSVPEDALSVKWERNGVFDPPSFIYNDTEYQLLTGDLICWKTDRRKMEYMGELLSGGARGRRPPESLFGISIYSGYTPAYGFYDGEENTPVLISNDSDASWINSRFIPRLENEQVFKEYTIYYRKNTEWLKYGGEYGVQFLYDDIVDQQQPRNIRVDSDTYRINVCCNLNLYSDVVKCLYVYLDVYDDEGVYCVAKAVDFAKGYYELILYEIKEPWQAMIRECTGIDSV